MDFFNPPPLQHTLQDDNSKIHQTHFVQVCFRMHEASFSQLACPAQTPDLNPTLKICASAGEAFFIISSSG